VILKRHKEESGGVFVSSVAKIKDIPLWQQGNILGCIETIRGAKPTIVIKSQSKQELKEKRT